MITGKPHLRVVVKGSVRCGQQVKKKEDLTLAVVYFDVFLLEKGCLAFLFSLGTNCVFQSFLELCFASLSWSYTGNRGISVGETLSLECIAWIFKWEQKVICCIYLGGSQGRVMRSNQLRLPSFSSLNQIYSTYIY